MWVSWVIAGMQWVIAGLMVGTAIMSRKTDKLINKRLDHYDERVKNLETYVYGNPHITS